MNCIMRSTLFLLLAALLSVAANGANEKASYSPDKLPYPFAPPSDEFCDSNTLGDDAYFSVFAPCNFVFYDTEVSPKHFECDAYGKDTTVVKKEQRKVIMWPESCVAAGPRCYLIDDYPNLYNFTLFNDTDFAMTFPKNATVVSVDCTADYAKVNEFIENLPEELKEVAGAISFAAGVFLFAVIAAIVACICLCWCACRGGGRRSPTEATYVGVPSNIVKAHAIPTTTVYGTQPESKSMV